MADKKAAKQLGKKSPEPKKIAKPQAKAGKTPPAKKAPIPAAKAKPAPKAAKPAPKAAKPAPKAAKPAPKAAKPAPKAAKPAPKAAKPAPKPEPKIEKTIVIETPAPEPTPAPRPRSSSSSKSANALPPATKTTTPKKPFVPPAKSAYSVPSIKDAPTIIVEPITDPEFLKFVDKQKQRLLDLRDDIVDAMTGTNREAIRSSPEGSEASGSGMHQGDAGSDAYDRDFALSMLAKEQDALYEIEEALHRIKKRIYGICEMSGKRIPAPRLEAIPFARLTVECQAQWEKEFGTKKFRPSGSVGFSGGGIFDDDEDSDSLPIDDDDD
jgi:DnaK suppressor protein